MSPVSMPVDIKKQEAAVLPKINDDQSIQSAPFTSGRYPGCICINLVLIIDNSVKGTILLQCIGLSLRYDYLTYALTFHHLDLE